MWPQNYTPLGGSLAFSALAAALPVFALLYLLGIKRKPSWIASLAGLGVAVVTAAVLYQMPADKLASAVFYGAAFGLFPIGWVVFAAIFLYRITLESGKFEIVKDSVGSLTEDRRLQALLIAFAFGAFIEGAAGFGTPVAVAAAMLAGLGFSPFYAAGICLLANTAPVAFGSIGTPVLTLSVITGLPLDQLCIAVGRICAPVSLIVPTYLIMVMGGWKALRAVLPATLLCGVTFAGTQLLVTSSPARLTASLVSSLASMAVLVVLIKFWKPSDTFKLEGDAAASQKPKSHSIGELISAWGPYVLLVLFVVTWGYAPVQAELAKFNLKFNWPGLHNMIARTPPVVNSTAPYAAVFTFNWLGASGTACFLAALCSAVWVRMKPGALVRVFIHTVRQLLLAELTIATVLALAFLMNYSGATGTLGLAFAATGILFPFFSALLGWVGVFLTGSDTSANALFGTLQEVTARKLGMNPVLMAAANSAGGVVGKMISLQSIAVAAAATGMKSSDEARLFRFTLKHSVLLATFIGLITMFYAYVLP